MALSTHTFSSIVQPVIYLLAFGLGLGSIVKHFGHVKYVETWPRAWWRPPSGRLRPRPLLLGLAFGLPPEPGM